MSAVPLAEVRAYLGTDADDDTALQEAINTAELYASSKLGGPLLATAVTQRCRGYGQALVLEQLPVISVTSVTDSSNGALVVANLDVDTTHGLIHWNPYGDIIFPFPFYTVVYQAGYATLPADLVQAVKSRTSYIWAGQRGPTTRGSDPEAEANAERARADAILAQTLTHGYA